MEYVVLSNGVKMPKLGFGVFQIPQNEMVQAVIDAAQVGHHLQKVKMVYLQILY